VSGEADSVSTAIVRIHTSEGLVVASDTLVSNESPGRQPGAAQKIFKIDHALIQAAYAISGQIAIIQPDGELLLEIPAAIHEAVNEALQDPSSATDMYNFSTFLANVVVSDTNCSNTNRRDSAGSEGMAHTHLCGRIP
jgi:hypothetical protein